jgi:hypothetical protein
MKNNDTYPFLPKPLQINEETIRGKLYIEGSLEYNRLSFRFVFDKPEETAPLEITIQTTDKTYHCRLLIREEGAVRTPFFNPAFYPGRKFTVSAVETLANFNKKTEQNNGDI